MSPSLEKVRPIQRQAEIATALLWALLASVQVSFFLAKPSVLQAGFVIFSVTIPLLFNSRRPAPARDRNTCFGWLWWAPSYRWEHSAHSALAGH
jgi:hypothetical protein